MRVLLASDRPRRPVDSDATIRAATLQNRCVATLRPGTAQMRHDQPMLTAADVARVAEEEGLGAHAEELLGCVRAGWRIVPAGDGPASGRSRVGGSPDLTADEQWPRNGRGIPLAFVAQIDCGALPPIDPRWAGTVASWRHEGQLVRLFTDAADNWEFGAARALTCASSAELTRTSAPALPEPFPPGGPNEGLEDQERARYYVLPETAIRLEPFLTAPETHPRLAPEQFMQDETADRYLQWTYRLRVDGRRNDGSQLLDPWAVSHLLGEATSVQEDVRGIGCMVNREEGWGSELPGPDPALVDEDAWQVMLGLHTGLALGLEIHDGGSIHLLAPVADLAVGRLDRLLYVFDSC